MRLKVVKAFYDKETNELYEVGSVIGVTKKRGKEILASEHEVAELAEKKEDSVTVGE